MQYVVSSLRYIPRRRFVVLPWLLWAGCQSNRAALAVFAASSLREVFDELGRDFGANHPKSTLHFDYAGSQELRLQVEHGAPADVVACADRVHMHALTTQGLVGPSHIFAHNTLIVVTPRGQQLSSLADLPQLRRIVIAAPEVPAGRYALSMLDRAKLVYGADFRSRVEAQVVSREPNVRQVLAKVVLGEADAAIVYRTDAMNAGPSVERLELPENVSVRADYPIAVTRRSREPELAQAFVQSLANETGRANLARHGFLLPEGSAE